MKHTLIIGIDFGKPGSAVVCSYTSARRGVKLQRGIDPFKRGCESGIATAKPEASYCPGVVSRDGNPMVSADGDGRGLMCMNGQGSAAE